ncbi:hypothetical protein NM208_g9626 [Fusarium decemcellulare]|uniref:Uncharacterized protein n=1 Tax=Fusarium decemcellulare TaxID=57161 RepID=A0ACC1S0V1_9HYPO|nr:hypothetical protein NM208_g9626 [Fusarium decemcellulare]
MRVGWVFNSVVKLSRSIKEIVNEFGTPRISAAGLDGSFFEMLSWEDRIDQDTVDGEFNDGVFGGGTK